jgi:hypothetical protein
MCSNIPVIPCRCHITEFAFSVEISFIRVASNKETTGLRYLSDLVNWSQMTTDMFCLSVLLRDLS